MPVVVRCQEPQVKHHHIDPVLPILIRAELWIGPREEGSRIAGGDVIQSALTAGVLRPVVWGPVPLGCLPVAIARFDIPRAAIPGPPWR